MPRANRYPVALVIRAIHAARGIRSHAAALLGCTRRTVDHYVDADPDVAAACLQERETLVDRAEAQLRALIARGHKPAIRFVQATLGRSRILTERADLTPIDAGYLSYDEALVLIYGQEKPPPDHPPPADS